MAFSLRLAVLAAALALPLLTAGGALAQSERRADAPVSQNASNATRRLLREFYARKNLERDRVAIGQQLVTYEYGSKSDKNAWYRDWSQMERHDLPLPLIMGGETSDLMRYGNFFPNQAALREMIKHGRAGNIVTLVWHPDNPAGGDFSTPEPTSVLVDMVDDATPTGQAWQTQLDRAGAVLKQFADAGVPVMFRPLHEQNGTFFWWGHDGATGAALSARQQAWTAMWQDMVEDLTVRQGIDDLLFVFGTNQVNYDEVAPPLTYYPGDTLVDMVSIDLYDDELDMAGDEPGLQYYNQLVGTGKPFGISEFGQAFGDNGTGAGSENWDVRILTQRLRANYPKAVFAIAWYSAVENGKNFWFALPDVAQTKKMMRDPIIDTQDVVE